MSMHGNAYAFVRESRQGVVLMTVQNGRDSGLTVEAAQGVNGPFVDAVKGSASLQA